MYILVLLFGIINFYFLFTTLIMLLGVFTEYVQIPLINLCAKTFRLPIHYVVEKILVYSNTNIFNIIFNQNDNKLNDDNSTESNEESNSDNTEFNEQEKTNNDENTDYVNDDSDENSSLPDLIDETKLNDFKNTNKIIIDETLD